MLGRERPPFQPGNVVSLRHGANSERAITERAEQVHAEITAVAPWLAEEHFAPAVVRYLRAGAREVLLDEYLQRVCEEKGAGAVPARLWEQVTAASRLAARLGGDLGLDPIGHARLKAVAVGAEVSAVSLAELAAEGRAIRAARQGGITTSEVDE